MKYKDLSPPLFIEEVAQAKRGDEGVKTPYNRLGSQTLTLKSIGLQIRLDGGALSIFIPPWILSLKVKHKDSSPPLFIEEVAQAKRGDGGV